MKTLDDQNYLISAQFWHHFIKKKKLFGPAEQHVGSQFPNQRSNPIHASCSGNLESEQLDHQGSPYTTSNCGDKMCEGFECRATGLVCVLMTSECPSCKGIKDNPGWPPRYTDEEELA